MQPVRPRERQRDPAEETLAQLEESVHRLFELCFAGDRDRTSLMVYRARQMLELNRRRRALLGTFFTEPSWDMLLELFVRDATGEKTLTKDINLLGAHSSSTAIRRTSYLIELGLVEKRCDGDDGRRALLALTARGRDIVATLLDTAARP